VDGAGRSGVKRRQFAGLFVMSAAVQVRPAFAQGELPLVAVIVPTSATQASDRIAALRTGLREVNLVEDIHYTLALRFGDGVADRLPGLILELGALKPRVIVSAGISGIVKRLLPNTPHVFTAIGVDPVKIGLVDSYAHPGGNVTGNVLMPGGTDGSMTQKRIDLFHRLVPNLKRLGFIGTKTMLLAVEELEALRGVAGRLGFELVHHPIQTIEDIEAVVTATVQDGVDALYVSGEPVLIANLERTVKAIALSGKAAVGPYSDFGRAGLLMSYSADLVDGFRRAGIYVGRILRGENPGNLPVEQASKFTLIVNTGTAKRLGIVVPPTFVADEVIE
jgi:putative tryptophan/tyrosine transport system substrate-binding protein